MGSSATGGGAVGYACSTEATNRLRKGHRGREDERDGATAGANGKSSQALFKRKAVSRPPKPIIESYCYEPPRARAGIIVVVRLVVFPVHVLVCRVAQRVSLEMQRHRPLHCNVWRDPVFDRVRPQCSQIRTGLHSGGRPGRLGRFLIGSASAKVCGWAEWVQVRPSQSKSAREQMGTPPTSERGRAESQQWMWVASAVRGFHRQQKEMRSARPQKGATKPVPAQSPSFRTSASHPRRQRRPSADHGLHQVLQLQLRGASWGTSLTLRQCRSRYAGSTPPEVVQRNPAQRSQPRQ